MLKSIILRSIFEIQKILLLLSYYTCRLFTKKMPEVWVIGVDEIASNIHSLAKLLEPSKTVTLSKNKAYDHKYTYSLNIHNRFLHFFIRSLYAPILLGYLSAKHEKFFYIWQTGFLIEKIDGRRWEFSFLKKREKTIVCYFCGDDIRSIKLFLELCKRKKIDSTFAYYNQIFPSILEESYDILKQCIAKSADTYADIIFNAPVDQISYITRDVFTPPYMFPDHYFAENNYDFKFNDMSVVKLVHAPSSPIAKGTPLVRAAIKKLELEGYHFEYNELIGVSNDTVLKMLADAHIVLNQFYGFLPGLFGIEAMAHRCAVLMSADPQIEPDILPDADGAWMITYYWEVYDNLKFLLDNPHKIKEYATAGHTWAGKHCTYSVAKARLQTIFRLHNIS